MDGKELAKKRHNDILNELVYSRIGVMTMNEIRESLGLDSIPGKTTPRITNCKNCAAPINKDGYCEYCGTWYR